MVKGPETEFVEGCWNFSISYCTINEWGKASLDVNKRALVSIDVVFRKKRVEGRANFIRYV